MKIDLIRVGSGNGPTQSWAMGEAHLVEDGPGAPARLAAAVAGIVSGSAPDALLFWSGHLVLPAESAIADLLATRDDCWHGGLALGTGGLPRSIDTVVPAWMLNRDPDPGIEATSWRLSLQACLVRTEVITTLGFLDPTFDSLTAAGLEMGHRWITSGAALRHCPALLGKERPAPPGPLTAEDELRFVQRRFGRKWTMWAAGRMARTHRFPAAALARAARAVAAETPPAFGIGPLPRHQLTAADPPSDEPTVTVLVPTIERYPYLRVVLDQLRGQTRPADQIVVVDQTPAADRDMALETDFADLPLTLLRLDAAGQSSARNAGLEQSTGDLILFIDDDDEIEPDLIERHLVNLADPLLDVSSGTAVEPGSGELPPEFQLHRVSDTFPTNNTMARMSALSRSGWFDLAFDRGDRADHDLGMRLYLAGCRMILDPDICVLHHHAPRGGLRVHNARATTYGGSRQTVRVRRPLSATQIYLWHRYYQADQIHEAELLYLSSMLNGTGPKSQRLLRAGVQMALLADTRKTVQAATAVAEQLGREFPQIPQQSETGSPR